MPKCNLESLGNNWSWPTLNLRTEHKQNIFLPINHDCFESSPIFNRELLWWLLISPFVLSFILVWFCIIHVPLWSWIWIFLLKKRGSVVRIVLYRCLSTWLIFNKHIRILRENEDYCLLWVVYWRTICVIIVRQID